ncbi:hypothetical protein [Clostridium sp. AM58-1XD]|uniref:hypothetical protein n=1 Tax=Clostridium sp. AM58-1XD TaxID=2292307 RepID=UPI001FA88C5F|nr:hypothetical protein [Clostridium sp. AM58-1XD]
MAKKLGDYHITEATGFPFSRESKKIGKMDCVIPTTLESNVVQLHQLLFNDMEYSAPSSIKKISNKIAEDSGLKDVGKNAAPDKTGGGIVPKKTEAPAVETVPESTEETSEEETTEESTEAESTEETAQETEQEPEEEQEGPGSSLNPTSGPLKPGDSDKKPSLSESDSSSETHEAKPSEEPKTEPPTTAAVKEPSSDNSSGPAPEGGPGAGPGGEIQ